MLEATGLSREPITCLVNGNDLDRALVDRLLTAMKANSKPVKPAMLGVIGRDHFHKRFAAIDGEMESFDYRKVMDTTDGIPEIIETAFCWCPELKERRLVTGVNWSPGIINPFRELGSFGQKPRYHSQSAASRSGRAGDHRAARVVPTGPVHRPGQIRGGDEMKAKNIIDAVQGVTKKWAKQRKREERDASAIANRRYAMTRRRHVTIKDAAWQVMEEAYLKASANGTLPAHARQVMYAARGPHSAGRRSAARQGLRQVFHATRSCPTTSRRRASTGTWSSTLAVTSKSRTPRCKFPWARYT